MHSIEEIKQKIRNQECFKTIAEDGSFSIKIKEYLPYVCGAIHDGNNFREELFSKTALTDYERWYEEDPHTQDFIKNFPIVIAGRDSRFEYDLNRPPETAVYNDAWGKQCWKTPLSKQEKQVGVDKHNAFYEILDTLIEVLEEKYKSCIVFDIHSYNYVRHKGIVPLFNVGTENIDRSKYGSVVDLFLEKLKEIKVPNVTNHTKENDVFFGRGYLLKHITERFENTLVLATEVKKVYCNELTGESFPLVIDAIQRGFDNVILETAKKFSNEFTTLKVKKKAELLSAKIQTSLLEIDDKLFRLVKNFELLVHVNPLNLEPQKRRFFASKFTHEPQFQYKQTNINPFQLKRELYSLPIEKIKDEKVKNLYRDVINAYAKKIDMLSTVGTDKFLGNTIHYFGLPGDKDIENAKFLLHYKRNEKEDLGAKVDIEAAKQSFADFADSYGFQCKIGVSDKITSKAIVLNSKKAVLLKKGADIFENDVQMLGHHEIGVHMVTTQNSLLQPLKVFNIGLPLNTHTQEGLAICSEYFSGNLTIRRLRELALRVLAIQSMVKDYQFTKTFRMVHYDYGMDAEEAFYLCARIYRGGGFTKDYLYLIGFQDILQMFKNNLDIAPLLIGKTHIDYYPLIVHGMERGYLPYPKYITSAFNGEFIANNEDVELLVQSII